MKLLFLFVSQSSAAPGEIQEWEAKEPCGKFYDRFNGECYFELLQSILDKGFIDDLKIIYESNREPGYANWLPGVHCEVMPHISFAEKYIEDDTIIFVRGGFKNWLDWLRKKYKGKNWIILYAANTGRERWPHWDIVLDDINYPNPHLDTFERIWYPFIKPVNEKYFYPKNFEPIESSGSIDLCKMEYKFDICIGSSHIHDRKGQWRMLQVAKAYNEKYKEHLKMIMPGVPRGGGIHTAEMFNDDYFNSITITPGYVDRSILNDIFGHTKIYVNLGAHGQNDRGPLEALAAGMPILLGSPSYHSPLLSYISMIPDGVDNYYQIADMLFNGIKLWNPEMKKKYRDYYDANCSFQKAVEKFSTIIRLITDHKPTIKSKKNIVELLRGVNYDICD